MSWRINKTHIYILSIIMFGLMFKISFSLFHTNFGQHEFGLDTPAYISSILHLQGKEHFADYIRPPLAPGYTLLPFIELFGNSIGTQIWAALVSTTVPLAAWLWVSKYEISTARKIVVIALITFDPIFNHLWHAGAVIMLPTALIFTALYGMFRNDRLGLLIMFLSIILLPLLNIPSFIVAAIVLGVFWIHAISVKHLCVGIAAAIVATILYWPYRVDISYYEVVNLLIITPPTFISWWISIPCIIAFIITIKHAILKDEHKVLALLFVIGWFSAWILPTNEVFYNIPLRLSFVVLLIAYIYTAKHGHKLLIIPALLLIIVSPIVQGQTVSLGHSEIKNAIERHLQYNDQLYITDRYLAFWANIWTGKYTYYHPLNTGVQSHLLEDVNNYYCTIGSIDTGCKKGRQIWIVSVHSNEQDWWSYTPSILKQYYGYTGVSELPDNFNKLEHLTINGNILSVAKAYIIYEVRNNK